MPLPRSKNTLASAERTVETPSSTSRVRSARPPKVAIDCKNTRVELFAVFSSC
jgi:hypothetical protein